MADAIRELSNIGAIITWNDVDERKPKKQTRQLMLADFFTAKKNRA